MEFNCTFVTNKQFYKSTLSSARTKERSLKATRMEFIACINSFRCSSSSPPSSPAYNKSENIKTCRVCENKLLRQLFLESWLRWFTQFALFSSSSSLKWWTIRNYKFVWPRRSSSDWWVLSDVSTDYHRQREHSLNNYRFAIWPAPPINIRRFMCSFIWLSTS